ncbi:MAG: hypothetical protein AAF394_09540 [Planctomycetota bacterium]
MAALQALLDSIVRRQLTRLTFSDVRRRLELQRKSHKYVASAKVLRGMIVGAIFFSVASCIATIGWLLQY